MVFIYNVDEKAHMCWLNEPHEGDLISESNILKTEDAIHNLLSL